MNKLIKTSISELTVVHNNLTEKESSKLDDLLQNPASRFKCGLTARVYPLSKNKVVRIQARIWTNKSYFPGTAASNTMYKTLQWQTACFKVQSQHVPDLFFIGFKMNKNRHISVLVTVMEKLKPIPVKVDHIDCINLLSEIQNNMTDGSHLSATAGKYLKKHKKFGTPTSFNRFTTYMTSQTNLEYNDIHDENAMVRPSTGCLVITDPIA